MNIPKEDLQLINGIFQPRTSQAIVKDTRGRRMRAGTTQFSRTSYVFKDFRGKRLKANKSLIAVGSRQVTVGVRGQLFETIPEDLRNQIDWSDNDFE